MVGIAKSLPERRPSEIEEGGEATASTEGPLGSGPSGPHNLGMISERLAKLEGSVDTLRWAVAFLAAVTLSGFGLLGTQMVRIDNKLEATSARLDAKIDAMNAKFDAKLDAIPKLLADEFARMRAETAAQTSAIANSITAAKAQPVQVIMVPAPQEPGRK
jgi:uncharacterized protein HemX